jgi:anti-sigma B factor antagonist
MRTRAEERLLPVEQVGDVTVARLDGNNFWDDDRVRAVREPLQGLLKQPGRADLLVEFGPVDHLSSSAVGLLVGLHLRARAAGGRLALCGLSPHARSVLERIRVNGLLAVYPAREQALASFGPEPQPGS